MTALVNLALVLSCFTAVRESTGSRLITQIYTATDPKYRICRPNPLSYILTTPVMNRSLRDPSQGETTYVVKKMDLFMMIASPVGRKFESLVLRGRGLALHKPLYLPGELVLL